jgi:hypothetical protein
VHEDEPQLKKWNVLLVNNVKYFVVTFDGRKTWRLHIERTVARTMTFFRRE